MLISTSKIFALAVSFLGLALIGPSLARAADAASTEVTQIDHAKVENAFKTGGPLVINDRFKIQAGRRVTAGPAEIHERDTDIFYVLEGSATIVTGGTPMEKESIGPGEFHAKEITGGVTRQLAKGDVIVIPNGVPHKFVEVSGTFLYYVVKVTK